MHPIDNEWAQNENKKADWSEIIEALLIWNHWAAFVIPVYENTGEYLTKI